MSSNLVYFCIVCGNEFRPASTDTVICPSCGGPPEASATEGPQRTILMTASQDILSAPAEKARSPEEADTAPASEARFCIVCGNEFRPTSTDTVICPSCGGPPEAPEALEGISKAPQSTICIEPSRFFPSQPEPSFVSLRTFATEADVPLEWKPGDLILDLYEVRGLIGEGGMGAVYRIHHTRWNLDLVVKTPKPDALKKAGGQEAFISEAEAWMELGLHPHIVTCYYVRTLGGIPRVFAELVEGGSLKDWIRDRRLYAGGEREALKRILDVAIQFAWGLGYAHEKGIVHQDVKPANALMTPDGTLKVTDFGLTKAKGYTPAYAAPEQVLGRAVDARTDIWGWGVSVLEMFAGEVTWAEGSIAASALESYLAEPPSGLPAMPEGVADLLRKCFQDDPNLRPRSMDEVAERLMAIYQEEFGEPYPRQKPEALQLRADSLNNRGVSHLELGREEEAVRCWQEALEIDRVHLEANFNYGYYRWNKAELLGSEFLTQFRQLEDIHGQNPDYWRLLGWLYLEQGYVEEVEEILQKRGVKDEALERAHRAPDRPVIREVRRLVGHAKPVYSVAFSPDGRYALSGSEDLTVRLWNLVTMTERLRLMVAFLGVLSVAFSPDGHRALSGSEHEIVLLDLMTGREIRRLEGHTGTVWSVAFSPDGRYALSGSEDKTVRLWDLATGKEVRRMKGHTGRVESAVFSPDGRYALSGSDDKTLRLWDLATGRELRRIEGHTGWVTSVAFSPDGRYVLSGSEDKTVRLWDLATGKEVRRMEGHTGWVTSVAFSPDGRYALSGGSEDKTVRLWDLATGKEVRRMEGHTDSVNSVAFSPDGRYALSGSGDNTVRLWEVCHNGVRRTPYPFLCRGRAAGEEQKVRQEAEVLLQAAQEALERRNAVEAVRHLRRAQALPGYERDEEVLGLLAACGRQAGRPAGLRQAWFVRSFEGHTNFVLSVAFSPDGRYAISGSDDNTVRLWDLASGKEVRRMEGHTDDVYSVAISPDGRYALSGSEDRTLRLWDLASGKEVRRMEGHTDDVYSVAISPDGRYALSGSADKTVRLWDLASGKEVRRLEGHTAPARSVAFSPDSRYALSGSHDTTVRLWDVAAGREMREMKGHTVSWVWSVAFSPDGRYALSGSLFVDKAVRLWDVATGRELRQLEGHTDTVNSVVFSPDGRYALSGSVDKTVRLWDLTAGQEVWRMEHVDRVLSVAFSPDGRYALLGSVDKTLRLWAFDWEWEFPDPADWDEGARPYLEIFLTLHTPYGPDGLSRVGAPQWTEEDFQKLLKELGIRGYGWLRPEGVRRELERMARERGWKGG